MRPPLTRRGFLIAVSGVALGLAAGGRWVAGRSRAMPARWVERVVRDHLPGVALDEPSLDAFVREIVADDLLTSARVRAGVDADYVLPFATRRVPPIGRRLFALERLVLTRYLTGSNFFQLSDPAAGPVRYSGAVSACGHPFARFRT